METETPPAPADVPAASEVPASEAPTPVPMIKIEAGLAARIRQLHEEVNRSKIKAADIAAARQRLDEQLAEELAGLSHKEQIRNDYVNTVAAPSVGIDLQGQRWTYNIDGGMFVRG